MGAGRLAARLAAVVVIGPYITIDTSNQDRQLFEYTQFGATDEMSPVGQFREMKWAHGRVQQRHSK
jgi:hypothetical protein